ncbi:mutator family transposase [Nitrospirillum amazonense]|uniref:Mutator family transposase n=1 Tax=Nitrospirillum amazonense TaxID=28077 RepID=A0A560J998_9PROT|nr:mutator family transposase [Nitrospirillum amazonense]
MARLTLTLEKGADADALREMISFAAERLMELEVQALAGAGHGKRSADRLLQRNGYRERDWHTRAGTVERKRCVRSTGVTVDGCVRKSTAG